MEIDVILVKENFTQNEIGDFISQEEERGILAKTTSINRAEWRAAGEQGLLPSMVIITPAVNYEGEEIAIVFGKRFGIYRTFCRINSDDIELYLEEKAGVTQNEK